MSASATVPKPQHVPADLVRDFDYVDFPGHDTDVHLAWKKLHEGPDIFWSPRQGGHWVATRADDIDVMQVNHEQFSYRHITIPPLKEFPPLAPLELDPPEHGPSRAVLSPSFGPKSMRAIEPDLRKLSTELLERIVPQRACDFVESYAKRLPIVTFLRLVDLPLSDRDYLLKLTDMSVRPRDAEDTRKAYEGLHEYTQKWIRERREHPGPDLFSKIVNARIDDQPLTDVHTAGLLSTVLFGGLDTIASALSFTARCLAENPDARERLCANRDLIPKAVEEFLRRFGIPNTSRVMARDFEYKGLLFRAGEQILLPKALHGLDERRYPRPLELDFDRPRNLHAAFGAGPHHCPGSLLARMELKIFLEQWLERIPEFHLQPGRPPRTSSGRVNAVLCLPLAW